MLRVPAALAEEVAARNGLTIIRQIDGQDLFLVVKPEGLNAPTGSSNNSNSTLSAVTETIAADPAVLNVEPNAPLATPEVESPTLNGSPVSILDGLADTQIINYFDHQVWSRYVDQPATAVIGLAASHATAGTGGGIVAIIDTGVDPTHPALAGSLVPGYDFVHETSGSASEWADVDGSPVSILDGSPVSILDGLAVTVNGSTVAILDQATAAALDLSQVPHSFGHGTMVAGLVHLVAPSAKIMPLKAFQADGTSNVFDVVRAIYYAIDHGARVINMSFSASTMSPEIMRAINAATSHGIICVASAGNLGQETVVYPGGLRNVLGIGSTNAATPALRSSFSNYGDGLVSLGAPGEAIVTTYPGGHYAGAWGTSFSTPIVAGGAALLLQVDPTVDQQKAAELLAKGAQPMAPGMGRGRLNLAAAVQTVQDSASPTVTVTAPTSGGTVFGSVLISASASDNVAVMGVRLLLDGSPLGPEIAAGPFEQMWNTGSASNGTHTLTAIARDAAGNQSSTDISVTVANDAEAPVITLTTPVNGSSVNGTVVVLAAATDDFGVAGVQFTIDGVPVGPVVDAAPFELVWNTSGITNGTHTVSAIARDAAGHQTTTSIVVTVANDGAAPEITLALTSGATVGGTISLAASATDDIAVAGVQLLLDGAPMGTELTAAPYQISWNTVDVANGSHTVSAVARDAAGHQTTASVEVTVANDVTAPTVALALTPGATVNGTISVAASATDEVGVTGVQFLLDGASMAAELAAAPYEIVWNTAGVSNGTHTISAIARDAAGHQSTASVAVTVSNDLAAPTVALTTPVGGATVTGTAAVLATATDDVGVAGVQFTIDGVPAGAEDDAAPYELVWNTAAVANGTHTVSAIARDAAGHQTTTSVVVTVVNDSAAPSVTLNLEADANVSGTIAVVASATDDVGVTSVLLLLDGVPMGAELTAAPYEVAWNTGDAANGAHTITAIARDAAGHQTTVSVAVNVTN